MGPHAAHRRRNVRRHGARTGPRRVADDDLNGDGKPDLAVANSESTGVSVLLNTTAPGNATPSFAAAVAFPTASSDQFGLALGDLNGDGTPDLVVANLEENSISVLLNTTPPGAATPSFAAFVSLAASLEPISMALADLNGDGKADFVVANIDSLSVSVFLNATTFGHALAFASATDSTTGSEPVSVAVGDLNGDGRPDLAIADNGASIVSVLLDTTAPGATTPSFSAKKDFATGSAPSSVALGDLNGDGRPDLVVTNNQSNTVSVLLDTTAPGATTPSFATKVDFATGATPSFVAIGDLNGDGMPDVVVADAILGAGTISVLFNTTAPGATTPTFASKVDIATGSEPVSLALGDLNGDGRLDVAVANEGSSTVSVLINTTSPGASTPSFATKVDLATSTRFVAFGDLNGDGVPDLAVANASSNTVSVFFNTTAPEATTASFSSSVAFSTGVEPFSIAVVDLDGDGRRDLAIANEDGGGVSVLLNTGAPGATTPSFATQVALGAGSGPESIATCDLNGDGRPDLVVANNSGATVSTLLSQ